MNQTVKVILMLAFAAGTIGMAMDKQLGSKQEEIQKSVTEMNIRLRNTETELEAARQRQIKLQGEVGTITDLEAKTAESQTAIPEEQAKIKQLLEKWAEVEKERLAAVDAVRAAELKATPRNMKLADGSVLEGFVLRKLTGDETLTVEHNGGLVKLTADKLNPEYITRLGLGWKPVPPVGAKLSPDDEAIMQEAKIVADEGLSPEELAESKAAEKMDLGSQLARVEASLGKAEVAFDAAKAKTAYLRMFKSDATPKNTSKTYGELRTEASEAVAAAARKVEALRVQRNVLQKKIKGIKTDGF